MSKLCRTARRTQGPSEQAGHTLRTQLSNRGCADATIIKFFARDEECVTPRFDRSTCWGPGGVAEVAEHLQLKIGTLLVPRPLAGWMQNACAVLWGGKVSAVKLGFGGSLSSPSWELPSDVVFWATISACDWHLKTHWQLILQH
jgi:hypothetical protein